MQAERVRIVRFPDERYAERACCYVQIGVDNASYKMYVCTMNRLRELRKQAGIDAPRMAALMGVSEETVSSWEMGRRGIRPERARAALAVLADHGVHATLDTFYSAPQEAA